MFWDFGVPIHVFSENLERRLDCAKTWVREFVKKSYKFYVAGKGGVGKHLTIVAAICIAVIAAARVFAVRLPLLPQSQCHHSHARAKAPDPTSRSANNGLPTYQTAALRPGGA